MFADWLSHPALGWLYVFISFLLPQQLLPLMSKRFSKILDIWDKEYIGLGKCTGWPFHDFDPKSGLWHWLAKTLLFCTIYPITTKQGSFIAIAMVITLLTFGRRLNFVENCYFGKFSWKILYVFLTATKRLYDWFSLSVSLSVRHTVLPLSPPGWRGIVVTVRAGGRLPNLQNPYLCNRLTDFLHSKFCGIV